MKIAVCIKRVPDTETRFAIAANRTTIDPAGLKFDLSDFDGYAVEVALRLVEKQPPGEVVAVTLGPDAAQETLRKALSMGVDRGVHLAAAEVPFDGLAIARALAAELLGLPCVSAVSGLELADGRGTAQRELEGATETVTFPLPAVLTIDEGIARPRLPSLKGIMAAKKKPVESRPAALGPVRLTVDALELPKERAAGRINGEGPDAVPELIRLLRDEAKVL